MDRLSPTRPDCMPRNSWHKNWRRLLFDVRTVKVPSFDVWVRTRWYLAIEKTRQ